MRGLLTILFLSLSLSVQATSYISDDAYVYLRKGAGNEFKIIGSVKAGVEVSVLDNQNGFVLILDDQGRRGWIEDSMVSNVESFRSLVPKLQTSLKTANLQIIDLKKQVNLLTQTQTQSKNESNVQLGSLKDQLGQVKKQLINIKNEKIQLEQSLASQSQTAKLDMWRQGGIIAGIGALIGIILVYLPKPGSRRRRSW